MTDRMKKPAISSVLSEKEKESVLPETELKAGNNNKVKTIATINASILIKRDSPRNCITNDFFSAPNTFLMPTSDERLEDRAVARFMKLIQAIINVKMAIEPRIYR